MAIISTIVDLLSDCCGENQRECYFEMVRERLDFQMALLVEK